MAFRLDKLTIKAQEAVQRAQTLAGEKGHPEMDPLHLLAALLDEAGRRRPADPGKNRRQRAAAPASRSKAELDRSRRSAAARSRMANRQLMSGARSGR